MSKRNSSKIKTPPKNIQAFFVFGTYLNDLTGKPCPPLTGALGLMFSYFSRGFQSMKVRFLFAVITTSALIFAISIPKETSAAPRVTAPTGKNNKLTNEPVGVISFEKPIMDFGIVKRGAKLSAKFNFQNTGKGPLTIQGVQASCDCTTVEAAKGKSFGPGETGSLEVSFDTTDYSGKVTKAITVITNERSMPDRTLTLTATVNSDVDAIPPLADFGDVVLNQTPQSKIRLKNNMKTEFKVEKIRYNEEFLDVGYTKEGHEFTIYVKLKPTVPIGFYKDTIWVKNNSSSLPEMPIPVRATIRGQIAATPAYIEFGSVAVSEKSSRQISLTAVEGFDITSNTVELNVNGGKIDEGQSLMRVSITPANKNGKKVNLELMNPGNKSGSVHGKVTLLTTNPQQKNLTVDFYAFFR
jgi:hypothetical protein